MGNWAIQMGRIIGQCQASRLKAWFIAGLSLLLNFILALLLILRR